MRTCNPATLTPTFIRQLTPRAARVLKQDAFTQSVGDPQAFTAAGDAIHSLRSNEGFNTVHALQAGFFAAFADAPTWSKTRNSDAVYGSSVQGVNVEDATVPVELKPTAPPTPSLSGCRVHPWIPR